jgi:hypothetical protein
MELFRNTRMKIGRAIFAKKIAQIKRKVHYSNFSSIKSIGIVWDASTPEDFTHLSRFYQKMHESEIEVTIFGYFPRKDLPDQCTAIRYLTYLRRKEISLFYIPVSYESRDFISKQFDILIDINFNKVFPLQYISSFSNAAFKVGLYDSETADTPFDLLMEIKKPVDINNYLNQIIEYLKMINSGTFIIKK